MKHIKDIQFPVYPLKSHQKIIRGKGPIYIITALGTVKVIDDTSIEGTFGIRRLKLKATLKGRDFKFYPLKKSLKSFAELAHHVKSSQVRVYIDSSGYLFNYTPSKWYRLTYHKIIARVNVSGKNWHIELLGINTPIVINYPPRVDMKYAGIIRTELGNVVYELTNIKKPSSKRKL